MLPAAATLPPTVLLLPTMVVTPLPPLLTALVPL
jgi:hypothetical protein